MNLKMSQCLWQNCKKLALHREKANTNSQTEEIGIKVGKRDAIILWGQLDESDIQC